jgi:hypothetical protein
MKKKKKILIIAIVYSKGADSRLGGYWAQRLTAQR